jgi:hypothetical protein
LSVSKEDLLKAFEVLEQIKKNLEWIFIGGKNVWFWIISSLWR